MIVVCELEAAFFQFRGNGIHGLHKLFDLFKIPPGLARHCADTRDFAVHRVVVGNQLFQMVCIVLKALVGANNFQAVFVRGFFNYFCRNRADRGYLYNLIAYFLQFRKGYIQLLCGFTVIAQCEQLRANPFIHNALLLNRSPLFL